MRIFEVITAIFKGTGKMFSSTFFFLFSKGWRTGITIILILILLYNSIATSVKEKSFKPLFQQAGMKIVASDDAIYRATQNIIKSNTKTSDLNNYQKALIKKDKILNYFEIVSYVWFLYIFLSIFIKFSNNITNNESAVFSNFILGLFLLALLQFGANFLIYRDNLTDLSVLIPFKGVWFFIVNLGDLLKPIENLTNNFNTTR